MFVIPTVTDQHKIRFCHVRPSICCNYARVQRHVIETQFTHRHIDSVEFFLQSDQVLR